MHSSAIRSFSVWQSSLNVATEANWLHCFSSSRMLLSLILPADLMGWYEDYLESSDAKLTKHSSFDLQSLKHMYDLGYTFRIIFTVPYKTATIFAFQMYLTLPLKIIAAKFSRNSFAFCNLFMQQRFGISVRCPFDKKCSLLKVRSPAWFHLIMSDIKLIPNNTRVAIDFICIRHCTLSKHTVSANYRTRFIAFLILQYLLL